MSSIFDEPISLNKWMSKSSGDLFSTDGNLLDGIGDGGIMAGGVSTTNPNIIASGEAGSILAFAKLDFEDDTEGWIQGMDTGGIYKWLIGGAASSIDWGVTTASTLTVKGTITGSTIIGGELHIPDTTTANSFHVNSSGDAWWGCNVADYTSDIANATAYISKDGAAKMSSLILTGLQAGSDVAGGYLTNNTVANIARTRMYGVNFCLNKYADFEQWANGDSVGVVGNGTATIDNTEFYFGTKCMKMVASAGDNFVYLGTSNTDYNVRLFPSTKYIVSFYVKGAAGGERISAFIRQDDDTFYNGGQKTITSSWARYEFEITTDSGVTDSGLIRLDNDTNGATIYIDGVQLELASAATTPEASSWKEGAFSELYGTNIISETITTNEILTGTILIGDMTQTVQTQIESNLPKAEDFIASWTFDEGQGGTSVDETTNGFDATWANVPTYIDGISGTGLSLIATSSQRGAVTHDAALHPTGDFSVYGWIRPDDITTNKGIITKGGAYILWATSEAVRFQIYGGGSYATYPTTGNVLSVDTWYFCVGTFTTSTSGMTVAAYTEDGTLVGSGTATKAFSPISTNPLYIANWAAAYVNGDIDECGLTSTALTDTQIQAMIKNKKAMNRQGVKQLGGQYQSAITGAYFKFDPTTGLYVQDDASAQVLYAQTAGANVGDVIIGDYTSNEGVQYDKSAGTFSVRGDLRVAEEYTADGAISQLDVCVQADAASEAKTQEVTDIEIISSFDLVTLVNDVNFGNVVKIIKLDDNLYAGLAGYNTGFNGFAVFALRYLNGRWVVGTLTVSNSAAFSSDVMQDICKINSNSFALAWQYFPGAATQNNINAYSVDIETLGLTREDTAQPTGDGDSTIYLQYLSDGVFACAFSKDGVACANALYSYSGTTLTEDDNDNLTSGVAVMGLSRVSATKYITFYVDSGGASVNLYAQCTSYSGTTQTVGTRVTVDNTYNYVNKVASYRLEDDKLLVSHAVVSALPEAVILSVSGTTITVNTPLQYATSGDKPNKWGVTSFNAETGLVMWNDGTSTFQSYFDISGTTITERDSTLAATGTTTYCFFDTTAQHIFDFICGSYQTQENIEAGFFKSYDRAIGIAPSAISNAASGLIQNRGKIDGLSGLVVGDKVYDQYDNRIIGVVKSTSIINIV